MSITSFIKQANGHERSNKNGNYYNGYSAPVTHLINFNKGKDLVGKFRRFKIYVSES